MTEEEIKLSLDLTYKELKPNSEVVLKCYTRRLDLTYKELKLHSATEAELKKREFRSYL